MDRILRGIYRVEVFSDQPECILRLSIARSQREILFSDGCQVNKGDPIVAIHLWNERLAQLIAARRGLGVGAGLLRCFRISLILLASYLKRNPPVEGWMAVVGEVGFVTGLDQVQAILGRLGFEIAIKGRPGNRFWRRAFWDNLFSYALAWTFNPGYMQGKRLTDLVRIQVWMPSRRLNERYGSKN